MFGFSVAFPAVARAGTCEDLRTLKLANTEIKSAELVAAGAFVGPGAAKHPDMPASCRVVASVKADNDSDIGVEVWLPAEHWVGVFHGNGNGFDFARDMPRVDAALGPSVNGATRGDLTAFRARGGGKSKQSQ